VNYAREQSLLLAVRGGGHAGFSTCNDGVILDLSPMNTVEAEMQAGWQWIAAKR